MMPRRYHYIGPASILDHLGGHPPGTPVHRPDDARRWLQAAGTGRSEHVVTYTVSEAGVLHIADRHSEHVACAGFRPVRGAGELTLYATPSEIEVLAVTNQSTGYCPEPACWPEVRAALVRAGLEPPDGFDPAFLFRRCPACASIHVVKDAWFVCACGADLPAQWNFDVLGPTAHPLVSADR